MLVLSTFWDVVGALFFVFFILMPLALIWGFALMDLFVRKDIRWRKILWLLFIIFVPVIGGLVYLMLRGSQAGEAVESAFDDSIATT